MIHLSPQPSGILELQNEPEPGVTEVLRVDQVHVIRHKVFVEGLGIRCVAKQMGLSRNTVRKYVADADQELRLRRPRTAPVQETIGPRAVELLDEWSTRTTAKQRVTIARLHEQLRSEGYETGISSVREVVWEWRRKRAEGFVPLIY